jgi:hypothetical protein
MATETDPAQIEQRKSDAIKQAIAFLRGLEADRGRE